VNEPSPLRTISRSEQVVCHLRTIAATTWQSIELISSCSEWAELIGVELCAGLEVRHFHQLNKSSMGHHLNETNESGTSAATGQQPTEL
jgi:hypothetical protein